MYINFELLYKKGLDEFDVVPLLIINQQRGEKNLHKNLSSSVNKQRLLKYKEMDLITKIKGRNADPPLSKVRLTKKGKKLLNDIQCAYVKNEDIILFDWLEKIYKKLEKTIGNKKRTKEGIAQFRSETGINGNKLAILLRAFVTDKENMAYNNKLENVFFSSKNYYQVKFSLDNCRLYEYYEVHKEEFEKAFEKIDNQNNKNAKH